MDCFLMFSFLDQAFDGIQTIEYKMWTHRGVQGSGFKL